MATTLQIDGRPVRLDPRRIVGQGGEADVYDVGGERAVKVYKAPDHADYRGLAQEQEGARRRIALAQSKLPAFPSGLPGRVVGPEQLALDASGRIAGFAMPLLRGAEPLRRYADRGLRDAGVGASAVVALLADLHATLGALHASGVVVGDLNDANVLCRKLESFLIDADSFQFGPFACSVFTEKFVDPLICDPRASRLEMVGRHDPLTDWYAFTVMVMQSLLLVGPWGGTHKPAKGSAPVSPAQRVLGRITAFHPEVRWPRPAYPREVLPDGLLAHLHRVFAGDERGTFPLALLSELAFQRCGTCGLEHARRMCPACAPLGPRAPSSVTRVNDALVATLVLSVHGLLLCATHADGKLRWLCREGGSLRREDGSVAVDGSVDPWMRFAISGEQTLIGRGAELVTLAPGRPPERLGVDSCEGMPVFAAHGSQRVWAQGGMLMRSGPLGPESVGEVLAGQTRLWLGERLGAGFYRAGGLSVAFVVDPRKKGLADGGRLPPIPGEVVEAHAAIAAERVWLLLGTRQKGAIVRIWIVLGRDGRVEAIAHGDEQQLPGGPQGACAQGSMMLIPTDDGIVRFEVNGGAIARTKTFAASRPWVDSGSRLLPGPGGLYVAGSRAIHLLRMDAPQSVKGP